MPALHSAPLLPLADILVRSHLGPFVTAFALLGLGAADARAVSAPVPPERGAEPAAACGPASPVGTPGALAALIPRPFRSLITGDLRATAEISLDLDDPTEQSPWRITVRVRDSLPGVERAGSSKVRIAAGASFRMQSREQMGHPPGYRARTVTFLPPCSAPCAAGEQRCATDRVCYSRGEEFCLACTSAPPERCACLGPGDKVLPDQTQCSFVHPGSLPTLGKCQAGSCR
jgi:hypothetical protein